MNIRQFFVRFFTTYILPTLDYASIMWCSVTVCLTTKLERVQRRFTRRLFHYPLPHCEDRLRKTGLVTPQNTRLATDLIFAFKCIHGLVDVDHHHLGLELSSNATKSHGLNLIVQRAFCNRVDKIYNYIIAREWNSLIL